MESSGLGTTKARTGGGYQADRPSQEQRERRGISSIGRSRRQVSQAGGKSGSSGGCAVATRRRTGKTARSAQPIRTKGRSVQGRPPAAFRAGNRDHAKQPGRALFLGRQGRLRKIRGRGVAVQTQRASRRNCVSAMLA